ncbi:MAG: prepilin-type N-terminal cleavage/methylation domain-containing protein [Candidatus Omnitrophica bacterium]|nr:prepilin-type N-terminal cleavage/methylation domain-containing protein [Candidatus Omnitrophota bacterium]MCA9427892.1 prepilin-type N-terminal cleavage/methylation domain-containing protein [Candidatus Omnitrophota bacterium]MCB9769904.1 prepilin-type N-terminal cleavage/methylation domain-containing protein [Candidatus Omnitrophota bacterium]MCB9782748.1 prepilin-type N-terminal cleavage/methylation domain-containing protein [Candidatus Omnitrophota bacterium]
MARLVSPLRHRGFTLIELLIVIAIILILIAIALPNFLSARIRAEATKALADGKSIITAFYAYQNDWRRFPLDPHERWDAGIPTGSWALYSNKQPSPGTALTTPVAYMTSIPFDPFVTRYEIGTAVPDDTGEGQLLSMYYLGEWAINRYQPIGHERTKAFLYSVGPSLAYSWTGSKGNCYSTHYSPTNGTKSYGGLWAVSN